MHYLHKKKTRNAHKTGIDSLSLNLLITKEFLTAKINELNLDQDISGIIVQLSLPKVLDKEKVLSAVSRDKDIDDFHL